jgi:hypothetical protein
MSNTKNGLICKKCNTEYEKKDNNKDNDCTPDKCSIFETCECCGNDINCHRENLHILTKPNIPGEDLVFCYNCCQNRDEEILNQGWQCDECDEDYSDLEEDD